MKTLVINGSPREGGDTAALVGEFLKHIDGDVFAVDWKEDITPCVDCRFCWDRPGCAVKDGMQAVYEYLDKCDNVVLASPVWFSSLSGPLLNIASRFQTNFNGWFRRGEKRPADKKGVLILVGAQPGTEAGPEKNAYTIMRNMYVVRELITTVRSMNTDKLPAKHDSDAIESVRRAALALNDAFDRKCTEKI